MLGAGADADRPDDDGFSPLHCAADRSHADATALLIEAGASIDARDRWGNTPLARAVMSSKGDGEVIRLLREAGADPEATNEAGNTPVATARLIDSYDVAQFFADLP